LHDLAKLHTSLHPLGSVNRLRGLIMESSRSRSGGIALPWSESAPKTSYLQVLWYTFMNSLYVMIIMHFESTSRESMDYLV